MSSEAGEIVAQSCVLVLPSTDEFDSRTYRIASTLAGRGHDVTVVARLAPGSPADARHAAGYRIVRVPVSAVDGLPWPIRSIVRRLRRRGPGRPVSGSSEHRDVDRRRVGRAGSLTAGVTRAAGATVRLAAIGLTVRAQRIATERVAPKADLVHAMAYMGIPIGLALGRRDAAAVIYDARDIYLDAANLARLPGPARRLFGWIEARWARRASRVITVNDAYADVMAERFRVDRPLVVMNCSYRPAAGRTPGRLFHDRLGLAAAARVVLYHGAFSRDRGIEQLIEALSSLPADVIVVLLGYGALAHELERKVEDPRYAGRLFVLPAVAPTELLDWVASADVVAMPIQPTTLNHRLTTPNKLLEAMAAGVPVVASDLPGMAPIVRTTGCGVLCDPADPAAIARAIRSILDAPPAVRAAYRRSALDAVADTYNWESQADGLLEEYGRLTGRPW